MVDDYVSFEVLGTLLPQLLSYGVASGFLIATVLIFITYGVFKAISFFRY